MNWAVVIQVSFGFMSWIRKLTFQCGSSMFQNLPTISALAHPYFTTCLRFQGLEIVGKLRYHIERQLENCNKLWAGTVCSITSHSCGKSTKNIYLDLVFKCDELASHYLNSCPSFLLLASPQNLDKTLIPFIFYIQIT